jgi:hypothetical protein
MFTGVIILRVKVMIITAAIATRVYRAESGRLPADIRSVIKEIDPKIQRDLRFFVITKPRNAEKKSTTAYIPQEEGLVLGRIKRPRGTAIETALTTGTRRKCLGRAKITAAKPSTISIELKKRIEIIEAVKSSLANQLITQ